LCENFILAKNHRDKCISGVSYMDKDPLELVHTDLCGPMKTSSLIGKVYFMNFIDDFSQKTWVYMLKVKFEYSDIFNKFKFIIEKESGKYIKYFRSYKGGEYMIIDFMDFYQSHGIKRHFTTHYTTWKNGVVERKNQTIMNMARSMLKEKHFPN
jgi:hypothetical protein